MSESDWLTCTDPDVMLEHLVGKIDWRCLVLFVQACWQSIKPCPPRVRSRYTVVEQYVKVVNQQNDWDAVRYASEAAIKAASLAPAFAREREHQAALLRHVVGNPFRPFQRKVVWTPAIVALARSLHADPKSALLLHDALLEIGQAELAGHFRQEKEHPTGCWAVDLILGDLQFERISREGDPA